MYRSKTYRVRPLAEVEAEIAAVAPHAAPFTQVFLADGDALAAEPAFLDAVLKAIRAYLPHVQRVGIYGDSRAILRHGVDGLTRLRERGLGIVYFGVESGDEGTLRAVRKVATVERQHAAPSTKSARAALRPGGIEPGARTTAARNSTNPSTQRRVGQERTRSLIEAGTPGCGTRSTTNRRGGAPRR